MADLVFDFDSPVARLTENAGGKGAVLARMRNAGLPVPPGFVVSTQAYRKAEFVLRPGLESRSSPLKPPIFRLWIPSVSRPASTLSRRVSPLK